MTDWEITDLYDDRTSEVERWLITYRVPLEYAPDGMYSYSFPKSWFNSYAATYDYNLDDPAEVDDLFDHVTHLAYMQEVMRREGRAEELVTNPFEVEPGQAKATVKRHVDELKRDRPLKHAPTAKLAGRGQAATPVQDVHEVIRADMLTRLDKKAVADMAPQIRDARQKAQTKARLQQGAR